MAIEDAKQAVEAAVDFFKVAEIDPAATDIRVEEISFPDSELVWEVTLGYSRRTANQDEPVAGFLGRIRGDRIYKTFTIRVSDGRVTNMKMRVPSHAG